MNTLRIAALALIASLSLPFAAPALASKDIKPGAVKVDPKLGYVMVRVGPTEGKKMRAPTVVIWRYDVERSDIRTKRKKEPNPVPKGEDVSVYFGARPFMMGGDKSLFLASVTPGDYVIHGTENTCMCLGSYRFTVKVGEITDIGTMTVKDMDVAPDIAERKYAHGQDLFVEAAKEDDVVPPELKGTVITRASLIPEARFFNRGPARPLYFGGLLLNRAQGLVPVVPGDGQAMVARVKSNKDEDEVKGTPVLEKEKDQVDKKDSK